MATVAMTKDNETIRVDSGLVQEHQALGWAVASVSNNLANVDIQISAEDTDVINIALQLQDEAGAALAESISLQVYLSDDADGLAVTTAAPSGGVALGTDGACIPLVAGKVFLLNSDATGLVDIDITEAGAATWYLVLVFPNGERIVSDAITFAA